MVCSKAKEVCVAIMSDLLVPGSKTESQRSSKNFDIAGLYWEGQRMVWLGGLLGVLVRRWLWNLNWRTLPVSRGSKTVTLEEVEDTNKAG